MSLKPKMPLDDAIREVDRIMRLFICNKYYDAIAEAEKNVENHFFFHLLRAMFKSVDGFVTFQDDRMEDALESIRCAIASVDQYRRKRGRFARMIWTPDYDEYTDNECQAEGCYSVLSAFSAALTIASEKSLIGLLKAAYWGKTAIDVLRECRVISKRRTVWESEASKDNFCYGVFVGLGLYNLVVSMVPKRILGLLKFFGFHGDLKTAFKYLLSVAYGDCLFSPVAAIVVLCNHCQLAFYAGFGEPDLVVVDKLLVVYKARYPGSGFFLIFEGASSQIKGHAKEAIQLYQQSSEKFNDWPEWQNTCHWFIIWCYSVRCEWAKALEHIKILIDRCNWSKCLFTYQYAATLKMIEEETTDISKKILLREEIDYNLRLAPTFRRPFAGKTIYYEKFVTKRCQIYWKEEEMRKKKAETNNNGNLDAGDDDALLLPILDLFLFWNIFYTFSKAPSTGIVFLKKIESKLQKYPLNGPDQEKHFYLVLMKGIIHKYMGQADLAIDCLTTVLDNERSIRNYAHLPPLACLELGMLFKQGREYDLAHNYLNKAMKDYSHYLNETLVHIRAHTALEKMKSETELGRKRSSILSLISLGSLGSHS